MKTYYNVSILKNDRNHVVGTLLEAPEAKAMITKAVDRIDGNTTLQISIIARRDQ